MFIRWWGCRLASPDPSWRATASWAIDFRDGSSSRLLLPPALLLFGTPALPPLGCCCCCCRPELFTFGPLPPFVVAVVPCRAAIEENVSGDFVEALTAADADVDDAITDEEEEGGAELEDGVPTTESDIELPWPGKRISKENARIMSIQTEGTKDFSKVLLTVHLHRCSKVLGVCCSAVCRRRHRRCHHCCRRRPPTQSVLLMNRIRSEPRAWCGGHGGSRRRWEMLWIRRSRYRCGRRRRSYCCCRRHARCCCWRRRDHQCWRRRWGCGGGV